MELHWDGLINARDLGGMRLATGSAIKPGRLVRSGSPHTLSESGWRQLHFHGIRTVVNLMLDREIASNPPLAPEAVPGDLTSARSQLEPDGYVEEWVERGERWRLGTPHYYDDFVARYPNRLVDALKTVADGTDGLLEGRRLDEGDHTEAIHRLLAEHPAAGCFASTAEAEAVRAAITARLI